MRVCMSLAVAGELTIVLVVVILAAVMIGMTVLQDVLTRTFYNAVKKWFRSENKPGAVQNTREYKPLAEHFSGAAIPLDVILAHIDADPPLPDSVKMRAIEISAGGHAPKSPAPAAPASPAAPDAPASPAAPPPMQTPAAEPAQPGGVTCPSCGLGNRPGAKFCRQCGTRLGE